MSLTVQTSPLALDTKKNRGPKLGHKSEKLIKRTQSLKAHIQKVYGSNPFTVKDLIRSWGVTLRTLKITKTAYVVTINRLLINEMKLSPVGVRKVEGQRGRSDYLYQLPAQTEQAPSQVEVPVEHAA